MVGRFAISGGSMSLQLSGFVAGMYPALPPSLVFGCVHAGHVGMGNGHTRVSAELRLKSIISTCVGSRFFAPAAPGCSFLSTPIGLSVICRSRGVVLIGGGRKLLIRPSGGRCNSALVTQVRRCLCRGNRCGPSSRRDFHPTLTGQVSHGATNVIVTTGGTRTLQVLYSGVGYHRVDGRCLAIMRNAPGRGATALAKCLRGGRSGGGICLLGGGARGTLAVGAHCAILSDGGKLSLLGISLLANEARRVEIRVTSVNRTVLNSNGCNGLTSSGGVNFGGRTLYSCGLAFSFPASTNVLRCLGNGDFGLSSI